MSKAVAGAWQGRGRGVAGPEHWAIGQDGLGLGCFGGAARQDCGR